MKKKLNNKGFGLLAVLAAIVVLAAAGGVGAYVYHKNHKAKTASTTSSSSSTTTNSKTGSAGGTTASGQEETIATTDGKVEISIPSSWHVLPDSNNPDGKQIISNNAAPARGCLDINDANPCTYEASFQPKSLNPTSDQQWTLTVEKTDWTKQQAAQNLLGDLNAQNTVEQDSSPINGYDTLYVKVKGGDPSSEEYTDLHYFLEKDGYLVHFSNREQYANNSSNPVSQDYSAYEAEFSQIVDSIRVNL